METRANSSEATVPSGASTLVSRFDYSTFPTPTNASVLLLDDDCGARRQLARELVERGFAVEVSDDVDAATKAALRQRPALVVFELRLETGNGLELLARLRPELPTTRFVVLTHYGSVASTVRAMRLGATNYLCKPVGVDEVLRVPEQTGANDIHGPSDPCAPPATAPMLTLDEAIWEYINRTIEDAGSLSEAARRLGLWRQSLKRMVSKYRPPAPVAARR